MPGCVSGTGALWRPPRGWSPERPPADVRSGIGKGLAAGDAAKGRKRPQARPEEGIVSFRGKIALAETRGGEKKPQVGLGRRARGKTNRRFRNAVRQPRPGVRNGSGFETSGGRRASDQKGVLGSIPAHPRRHPSGKKDRQGQGQGRKHGQTYGLVRTHGQGGRFRGSRGRRDTTGTGHGHVPGFTGIAPGHGAPGLTTPPRIRFFCRVCMERDQESGREGRRAEIPPGLRKIRTDSTSQQQGNPVTEDCLT